uniref:Uncharacterized protein n=1 Tax=Trichuris muris TaxID=70415 RepID=A0A5S6QHD7_TRIMR
MAVRLWRSHGDKPTRACLPELGPRHYAKTAPTGEPAAETMLTMGRFTHSTGPPPTRSVNLCVPISSGTGADVVAYIRPGHVNQSTTLDPNKNNGRGADGQATAPTWRPGATDGSLVSGPAF